jgi:hypothetical protein
MEYTAEDWSVMVHHYPVDGSQITVSRYDGDYWATVVDSRFITDSFWESMFHALDYAGWHSDAIVGQLDDWEIFAPDDDEE